MTILRWFAIGLVTIGTPFLYLWSVARLFGENAVLAAAVLPLIAFFLVVIGGLVESLWLDRRASKGPT